MKHIKTILLSLISSIFIYFLTIFTFAYIIARENNNVKMLYPNNWDANFKMPYYIAGLLSIIIFIIQIKKPFKND
jgi:ABC-type tungstate transport system substrate-binding protein